MCTTCGCHSDSEHSHDKHHDEHHDENAYHAHPITAQTVIINHHHYHAPVAQYFYSSPSTDDTHIHQPASDCATHVAPHNHEDTLDYGQGEAGGHTPGLSQHRIVEIEKNVLSKNNHIAAHNREHFKEDHLLVLNLVSSPGSGKTTLLTETLHCLMPHTACMVIEGDQQTANDAERIRATGAKAIQINTGKGCHLDAQMVHDAVHELNPEANSLLFIENVGNLVCPASFDLGEMHKVVVLSVTEGEDKPLKYPHMFAASRLLLINKIDLLPYIDFDLTRCIDYAKQVNPQIEVILISAATGEGMEQWLTWLEQQQCA